MEANGAKFTVKIIWGALTMAMIVYVVISGIIVSKDFTEGLQQQMNSPEIPFLVGLGVGFIMLIAAELIPKIMTSKVELDLHSASEEELYKYAFTPFIIRWALIEFPVIIGLSLSAMLKTNVILIFFIPCFVLMLRAFPKEESAKNFFRR